METRLIGRKVAIETAPYDANANANVGRSTFTRTGPTREIDYADNGDQIP
ncbi:hypothetical protein N789_12965 [Arenimonas oryziterrae DSM 21050 = YC6267]|uniref:Uncharacterized protein n=2 Tax=Arenimonas TaxID=490567 RepID=A0A091AV63_9GAMM|nr:hypothetical protein N789_12965 [Arenimonas oryziterrae DSM 21050 = YC6267]